MPSATNGQTAKVTKKNRKGAARGFDTYQIRLLKQIHPGLSLSLGARRVMVSLLDDIHERVAREAGALVRVAKRRTLTARDIQSATRMVLRGELAKHAVAEGTKALTKYQATTAMMVLPQ